MKMSTYILIKLNKKKSSRKTDNKDKPEGEKP